LQLPSEIFKVPDYVAIETFSIASDIATEINLFAGDVGTEIFALIPWMHSPTILKI
jgi:hypothetical protein